MAATSADDLRQPKIEIFVRCSNLVNMDVFTKSDPVCVLYTKRRGVWTEFGRTEMINDNLNPRFSKTFVVDYYFDELQPLKFEVYDIDDESKADWASQDFIGQTEVMLSSIILEQREFTSDLKLPSDSKKQRGQIHLKAEEVEESKDTLWFDVMGVHLENKCSFLGSLLWNSSAFLEVTRQNEDRSEVIVYKTEVVMNSSEPHWKTFTVDSWKLCNDDYQRTVKFTCKHWKRYDEAVIIGSAVLSVSSLLNQKNFSVELISSGGQKGCGTLLFQSVWPVPNFTFVDYLKGGCGISVLAAIDFTSSNGHPSQPYSLHYNSSVPNEYWEAISSVCTILAHYDSDQRFPVWGFGGKLAGEKSVSHCFPLSGNMFSPEVHGVEGILQAYRQSLDHVELCGPTLFGPILEAALNYVQSEPVTQDNQNYNIFLIVTDGVIHDMQKAIDSIVTASKEALSIIIVGVGDADFTQMETLDADTVPLVNSGGETMCRDIVQFVGFRELRRNIGRDFSLAREVLDEVPGQLVSFMKLKGISPRDPQYRHTSPGDSSAPPFDSR
eukprot:m.85779 g.85779  ORF g.85779 m.85779 type:complete len:552 (+) comp36472_c0_seq1:90-1745(+)